MDVKWLDHLGRIECEHASWVNRDVLDKSDDELEFHDARHGEWHERGAISDGGSLGIAGSVHVGEWEEIADTRISKLHHGWYAVCSLGNWDQRSGGRNYNHEVGT